ncbi:MAG: hypothetical protein ABIQ06_05590 [Caldimonas sp.]
MRQSLRIESLAALLAGLIVGLIVVSAPAAAAEATGQIYQQRAADGRIVLTDRPSATAVTERTWQIDREDREAAQQRAFDVRREAEAVSERVQRRMQAQERLLAAEQERAWQRQRDQTLARADDERYYPGYVVAAPYPNRSFRYRNPPPFFELGTPPKRSNHRPSRPPGQVKEPASPGSR